MNSLFGNKIRVRPRLVDTLTDGNLPLAQAAEPLDGDDKLLDSYSKTIAAVVNRVAPSVVNIRVFSGERGQGGGSGFIIARDGFILTNSHVVYGARELEDSLQDRLILPPHRTGTEPQTALTAIPSARHGPPHRTRPD